jgi:hypothetical protein
MCLSCRTWQHVWQLCSYAAISSLTLQSIIGYTLQYESVEGFPCEQPLYPLTAVRGKD